MTDTSTLPELPFEQPHALAFPPLLRKVQAERPIARVRTPAGDEVWLVTRYADVRQLLGDARLGRSHPDPDHAPRINDSIISGPEGNFETEPEDHARMRHLMLPCFTARRIRALRPRVEALADQVLDALAARTPPADLHEVVSLPLPVLVICEMLGVPYQDRDKFQGWTQSIVDVTDRQRSGYAYGELFGYMRGLIARKRADPAEDVLSEMCAAEGSAIDDDYLAYLGTVLLFTGFHATAVRLDIGTLLLLANPGQRQAVLAQPDLISSAVEEILRSSTVTGGGVLFYAREDIEIGGVTIRPGDGVLLDIGAANHDERAFSCPDDFQATRPANAHLTFGYGARTCLGASLARMELQAMFARLIARFPTLRLAVPYEDIRMHGDIFTGRLDELLVTW
jgi:cytochrome P450